MPEDDQLEAARRLLARAGITPSEADLARVAAFMGQPYPRTPKLATEPHIARAVEEWVRQQ
jgi:3-oxoacyl-[acyl-carrier-protein] synthase III